ncbi:MAG: creatininase family protein [Pseudanabaenaceae cyanobacterium]
MHQPFPAARYFAYLTWQEVARLSHPERVVLLQPLGAIEQHGHHLPLAVDALITVEVLAQALHELDPQVPAYVLPPLYYGKSNEHLHFAGTVSLKTETLMGVLTDIGDSIYRAGFRKLAFVNGHGGQPQIVEIVARDLHVKYPDFWLFPLFIWGVPNCAQQLIPAQELELGIHGGMAETSLIQAIAPHLVKTEQTVCSYPPLSEGSLLSLEGACPFAWVTKDVSATGTIGDATLAHPVVGKELLQSLVGGWVRLIKDLYAFQPPLC